MSFGYFMNMEKLSLRIVEKHLPYMTDNNYEDDCFLNIEELINNIENGFVIITQLSCYFESFLNTVINACMNYNGEVLLKCSVEEKIALIFMHYQKDWQIVKGQNPWAIYRKTTKVRNEMIHFKKTFIGDGSGIPNFKLGGQGVADQGRGRQKEPGGAGGGADGCGPKLRLSLGPPVSGTVRRLCRNPLHRDRRRPGSASLPGGGPAVCIGG